MTVQDTREFDPIARAVEQVRRRTSSVPEIVLVLGSGLGSLADSATDQEVVPASVIPGYPVSTVAGHDGRLVFGRLEGRDVLFIQGRVHRYEGHSLEAVTFPIRLAVALGASKLVVTNAAGGINPAMGPGSLMFITGHLNFSFCGPVVQGLGDVHDRPATPPCRVVRPCRAIRAGKGHPDVSRRLRVGEWAQLRNEGRNPDVFSVGSRCGRHEHGS